MNTTAAALQAHVTVATIRTWCRRGAIAATKTAGRWIIETASLAHRIAIGARRRRETSMLDLSATYTVTGGPRDGETITPKVTVRERRGHTVTTIRGLVPLLANRINAIADTGDRLHTLEVLASASIVFSDQEGEFYTGGISTRDNGRLRTQYRGTPDLPVDVVLDLGEQLRTQLQKG
ncbi:helix-turn-helix domain-containing protein [Streptomyces platensis]|uniref:hypothetical protein n=1 Tax=Streptomyces platensis TaxID=58346 RepID=UPI002E127DD1|nr:helix-turn-helix domain-containing protein [Streptomyces platensis]